MVGWISPNVEDGVAAPGTPGLGEFFGAFGGDATISESFMKGWRFSSVVIEKNHD